MHLLRISSVLLPSWGMRRRYMHYLVNSQFFLSSWQMTVAWVVTGQTGRISLTHCFFRWLTLDLQLPKAVSRWIRLLCVFNYIYHTSVVVSFPIFWYLLPLSRRIWQQVLIVYISVNSTVGATWWREYSEVKILVRRSKLTISLWIKYESPKLCSHWIYHIELSKF